MIARHPNLARWDSEGAISGEGRKAVTPSDLFTMDLTSLKSVANAIERESNPLNVVSRCMGFGPANHWHQLLAQLLSELPPSVELEGSSTWHYIGGSYSLFFRLPPTRHLTYFVAGNEIGDMTCSIMSSGDEYARQSLKEQMAEFPMSLRDMPDAEVASLLAMGLRVAKLVSRGRHWLTSFDSVSLPIDSRIQIPWVNAGRCVSLLHNRWVQPNESRAWCRLATMNFLEHI